jgi:hypothetical protein
LEHETMTCRTDSCRQGRIQCPTPESCYRANPQGYESALPVQFLGDEPPAGISLEAKVLIAAVCLTWALVIALSFAI